MSVLIKGATMPKNCCECLGAYCDNNRWLCTLAGECVDRFIYVECGRPTFCPLVEIPPHGDLIDGTKLLNDVADVVENKLKQGDISAEDIWTIIMGAFNYAPTVIESEVEE